MAQRPISSDSLSGGWAGGEVAGRAAVEEHHPLDPPAPSRGREDLGRHAEAGAIWRGALKQDAEKLTLRRAAQKGPDARQPAKGRVRHTSGTPQRVSERANAAEGSFSAAG